MADTKDILAQAMAALDAERAADKALVDTLSVANIVLQAQLDTANQTIASLRAQSNTVSVIGDGSLGNAALQAAIGKVPVGGTVVASGSFLIDATEPLMVKDGITLDLTQATLTVQPNNQPRYYVLRTGSKVTIKGGHLIGDRLKHTYTAGSTHEWGYGLSIDGDDCVIDGMTIEQFTGDGICQAGNRTQIKNVTSTRNRRQGMSVFTCDGLRVSDSVFSATGAYLTDAAAPNGPCAGVDIEPDKGSVTDAVFVRCTFAGNRVGHLAWLRADVDGKIGFTLMDCVISGDSNGVWAKDAGLRANTITGTLSGNTYSTIKGNAIKADAGSVITATGETFIGILSRYAIAMANGGKAIVSGATYK